MAKTHFRVASILLDGEEGVTSVAAVATRETCRVVSGLLDTDCSSHPGDSSHVDVTLPVADALRLHQQCGQIRGDDPRHEITTEIYDSLCMVIYGLIED